MFTTSSAERDSHFDTTEVVQEWTEMGKEGRGSLRESSKMSLYWTTNKKKKHFLVNVLVTVYTSTSTVDATTPSHKPSIKDVVEQKYMYNIYYVLYCINVKYQNIFLNKKCNCSFFMPKED